ncbi:cupin domain-containing protein [Dysgonomonas macrotermitis]|uniref:Cupin domain protein n=1 Tax=Dysgonomonas macrotermitis TaxID=1346286 RepID=A0A1M4X5D8_9BACT|nr:cupin domain-containing protein [Dysgonomonas macrotermitis]SHE88637.1 Cupin domain protein [Dysgonomonas macrotermitis]
MKEIYPKATVLNMAASIEYSEGGVVSKQILKNQVGNITLFSFDKGQGLSEHTAPFDAFVQILDGEVEIKIDGKPFIVKANESIIMPANITHALYAVEKFKMLLTMIRG